MSIFFTDPAVIRRLRVREMIAGNDLDISEIKWDHEEFRLYMKMKFYFFIEQLPHIYEWRTL